MLNHCPPSHYLGCCLSLLWGVFRQDVLVFYHLDFSYFSLFPELSFSDWFVSSRSRMVNLMSPQNCVIVLPNISAMILKLLCCVFRGWSSTGLRWRAFKLVLGSLVSIVLMFSMWIDKVRYLGFHVLSNLGKE